MAFKKSTFKMGGIHPPDNKLTRDAPLEVMPLPALLVVPLNQHIGKPAKAVVSVGDQVKRGQLIGTADGFVSANVHAPTSGKIKLIGRAVHPSGQYAEAITIEPDGADEWEAGLNQVCNWRDLSCEEIRKRIQDAGVVGMGGAGFPTHVKLSPPSNKKIDTVILNGAECEPFLTSDYRLMLEKSEEVVRGLEIVASLFNPTPRVIVGIEANKKNALKSIGKAALHKQIELVELDTKYPQGGEKQLITALTGRVIADGQLPFDVGCLVQNVATCFAIDESVSKLRPLTERATTFSGFELKNRKNLWVRLGTRIVDVMEFCGGLTRKINQLIVGGPMMGRAQFSFDIPVTKTTSGVLFIDNTELDSFKDRPCIRCGRCVEVCPQGELPWLLVDKAMRQHADQLPSYGYSRCMECGSCSFVCPAKREIVHWIKYAKAVNARIAAREKAKMETVGKEPKA
ncbi:MAG: electron transport complex subunit RsxC [Deltaproteobacteria bacterium]|nr:electron transport complex subunit RsxC [Deltaproteobacteria bacterium]